MSSSKNDTQITSSGEIRTNCHRQLRSWPLHDAKHEFLLYSFQDFIQGRHVVFPSKIIWIFFDWYTQEGISLARGRRGSNPLIGLLLSLGQPCLLHALPDLHMQIFILQNGLLATGKKSGLCSWCLGDYITGCWGPRHSLSRAEFVIDFLTVYINVSK